MKRLRRLILLLILIIVGTYLYARYIGSQGLVVKEYPIVNSKLPESFDGMKIVHFSDLHYGSTIFEDEMKSLISKINKLKPDIVIFTGDLVEKRYDLKEKDKVIITKYLSKIDAKIGKYAVSGNHDYDYDDYSSMIMSSGFELIDNKVQNINYLSNEAITIIGASSTLKTKNDLDALFKDQSSNYTIFLVHEPDTLDKVDKYNIDLMLSGHSHRGQVVIPFVGPIVKAKGAVKYDDEKYEVNETKLFVSSGLGTSGLKIRLFNRPSINLYRLYKDNKI